MTELSLKTGLTFAVAAVYAAVGHGGASGYLAILSFFGTPHDAMASSALCLNLLVSGVAFAAYARAGHFAWSLSWPFALTSVPAAFVGGLLKISAASYAHLLAGVLVIGGGQLLLKKERTPAAPKKYFPRWVSLGGGAALGILSGMVGVGGGIFLSPLLILSGRAGVKETAATAAFFIFVNSLSGLVARSARGAFHPVPGLSFLFIAALLGGWTGSRLGAGRLVPLWLQRLLAGILFTAAYGVNNRFN
ncbi:MAG: sulfite exporter TauE/SafE family protein [Elusimicrobia bacterium]|nr:sulfite exporter TauE/SafE family protein [Elusimicrobiota bacterium]